MRRWACVAAAVVVVACGGKSAPSAPDPSGGVPLHLSPGFYTLTLDFGDSAGLVCVPPVTVTRATIPVVLQRGDADLTVQPQMMGASLQLRLLVSGDDRLISGTMIGSATSVEGISVEVFGASATEPALISGRADATSVQGMIIGQLTIAGATCTSTGRNWSLTPRVAARE
jgi:hypothetical protein